MTSFTMKKPYALTLLLIIAFAAILSPPAFGQDSLRTLPIQEVVVTATRTEQAALATPRSVTVISSREIESSIYSNVAELLSRTAGMYIVGTGQTPGANQNIFLRGANSNHVNILIDGVRINDPSSPNSALDLSELSLLNVERIEVVRGSHGPMYGTSGIGGVINIITKKNQSPGLHGFADVQGGTFGQKTGSLKSQLFGNYTFRSGLYANVAVQHNRVNGLNATVDTVGPGSFKTSDRDNFRKTDALAKVGFRNALWDAGISYKKINQKADIDQGAFNDDDNSTLQLTRNLVSYNASFSPSSYWQFSLLGGWTGMTRNVQDDSSVVDFAGNYDRTYSEGNYQGKSFTNEVQGLYKNKHFQVLLGTGHYDEQAAFRTYFYSNGLYGPLELITDYDSLSLKSSTKYVFSQVRVEGGMLAAALTPLQLSMSTRLSRHSQFGNNWTLEVNPSWNVSENNLLYASYATGFNAPSLYQLYDPTIGNMGLNAETSASYEVGWKGLLRKNMLLQLSVFQTTVRNSIDYVYLWKAGKSIEELNFQDYLGDTYINVAQQRNRGVEINLQTNILQKIVLKGNLGFVEGNFTYRPEDVEAEKIGAGYVQVYNNGAFLNQKVKDTILTRRPRYTASLDLAYAPMQTLTVGGNLRRVGSRSDVFYDAQLGPFGALSRQSIDSYILTDLYARYTFNSSLAVALRTENIFNERYHEIYGYQTRGRGAYLKVTFNW